MGQVICETCVFWHREGDRFANECRRLPPAYGERQNGTRLAIKRVWPMTSPIDWCGEHRFAQENRVEIPIRRSA